METKQVTRTKILRRVLLIEPNYKNKYPPLGLMKLASYHRNRGDFVRFYKGDLKRFVSDQYSDLTISKLESVDPTIPWHVYKPSIDRYIRCGKIKDLESVTILSEKYQASVENWLRFYSKLYRKGKLVDELKWDRICVTTLFTFYYKKTIDTINFCKDRLLKPKGDMFIGGVMASVIPDEIFNATQVKPIIGLLDKPGQLDKDDSQIIDVLTPDYSILHEIDYNYPESDGYLSYTSRGCIRKCSFCAVPTLEPKFIDYLPILETIQSIESQYGSRKDLLLLDNNVLASSNFKKIIEEIKICGFVKGAKQPPPNMLELAIDNIKKSYNIFAYRKLAHNIIRDFKSKLAGQTHKGYLSILERYSFIDEILSTPDQLIHIHNEIGELYEKRRSKIPRNRHVDFNQGIDARLITDEKMNLLASIPVKPLRIAFDSMRFAAPYENAIRLAHKHGITHFSNYLLFNFEDDPIELYQRMRLNVELGNELGLQIYSFPMRYSPIRDEQFLHHGRNYVGIKWNKKYIRAIQVVLNATKGKVGTKLDFFKEAFGATEEQYFEILFMPESYIMHRHYCEEKGFSKAWRNLFYSLLNRERKVAEDIIKSNNFSDLETSSISDRIKLLIEHYTIGYKEFDKKEDQLSDLKDRSFKHLSIPLEDAA